MKQTAIIKHFPKKIEVDAPPMCRCVQARIVCDCKNEWARWYNTAKRLGATHIRGSTLGLKLAANKADSVVKALLKNYDCVITVHGEELIEI